MFIVLTRLLQTAEGTKEDFTVINPAKEVAVFPGVVHSVDEAIALLPEDAQPNAAEYGAYVLDYDLKYSYKITDVGASKTNSDRIIVLYDIWADDLTRQSEPPLLRNSHEFGLSPMVKADLQAFILAEIESYIIRASLNGYAGNQRDNKQVFAIEKAGELYDKVSDMLDTGVTK